MQVGKAVSTVRQHAPIAPGDPCCCCWPQELWRPVSPLENKPTIIAPSSAACRRKLAFLKQNAAKPHPDPKPIELTEREANAYFNEGGVKLPKGVSNLRLTSQPGVIDGHAQVDFEKIMEGKGSTNPLLSLFSGVHDVHIVAQAAGAAGTGTIRTQSASLDGIEVPQVLLQYFAQHYITPKYPTLASPAPSSYPCGSTVLLWWPTACSLSRNDPAVGTGSASCGYTPRRPQGPKYSRQTRLRLWRRRRVARCA